MNKLAAFYTGLIVLAILLVPTAIGYFLGVEEFFPAWGTGLGAIVFTVIVCMWIRWIYIQVDDFLSPVDYYDDDDF